MATVTTCDPCQSYGLPGEDQPGVITIATHKTPYMTRELAEEGDTATEEDGYRYEVQFLDTCEDHHATFTGLYLRIGLAMPGSDVVTGWEPKEEEWEYTAPEGEIDPAALGMDKDDAKAVVKHIETQGQEQPQQTATEKLRASMMAKLQEPKPAAEAPANGTLKLKAGSASSVRDWAAEAGERVSAKGAIPAAVLRKFYDADPKHQRFFESV